MKIKSIIYCTIIITSLFIWWIQGKYTNTIEYNIENFLIIHSYMKRSYYKMITLLIDGKKSISEIKTNTDKIESFLIPISKKITKQLGDYIRGDEIFEFIKKNNASSSVDIFLFPDTFISQLGISYYKILVEHIHILFQKPIDEPMNDYKLLLESVLF